MTRDDTFVPLTGGCSCGHVRFSLNSAPIVVNCCHCGFCQRLGGSAFAVNAMIETNRVTLTGSGVPVVVHIPSALPAGQLMYRCPQCNVTLWSNHSMLGAAIAIVRVGTLDDGHRLSPDVHCYTESKHPWVVIPAGVPTFAQGYDPSAAWSAEAQRRLGLALQPPL
jgi:hypothetical protein